MRKVLLVVMSLMGLAGLAATAHFPLDNRTGTRAYSPAGEDLRYAASWFDGGATVRITDNGVQLVSSASGTYHWTTTGCGDHQLKLIVAKSNGTQVGTDTATFTLDHNRATTIAAVAATCTTGGRTAEVKCSRCGEVFESSQTLPALGHNRTTTIAAVAATCTTAGRTAEVKCSRCGEVLETSHVIEARGHSWSVTQQAVPATSAMSGRSEGIACSRCGTVQQESVEIPALGYIRNVSARQLWPHNKVEVAYEVAEDIGEVADEDAKLIVSCDAVFGSAHTLIGDGSAKPGLHRVVWDLEADGVAINKSDARFSVRLGATHQGAPTQKGLVHRWSFNGNLTDSVGGQTATAVGNVTTDGNKYRLSGGSRGASHLELGDLANLDQWKGLTVELWATQIATRYYSRILHIGKTRCIDMEWSLANYLNYDDINVYDIIKGSGFNTHLAPYELGVEYHIAVIIEKQSNGRTKFLFIKQNTETGEVLKRFSYISAESWNFDELDSYELTLGYRADPTDTSVNDANAEYNEVRVWNRALTEDELTANAIAGPDAVFFSAVAASVEGVSEPIAVDASLGGDEGITLSASAELGFSPIDTGLATVVVDGEVLLSATESGSFRWQPKTTGGHTLEHLAGTNHWTRTVNVTQVAFTQPEAPNPPTAEDPNIAIGSTSRAFAAAGGTVSITTSGSGTWNATSSADWLTFNGAASKAAGLSCIVRVAANTGVESRTGYVYVSGHVFTITQAGVGAELEMYSAEFGYEGGEGEVLVLADGQSVWNAKAESEWISVQETAGAGEAYVHFTVAPYAAVSDRTGYLTIAGRTFEVHQVGRELSISRLKDDFDYTSHAVEIDVTAFGSTEWYVTPFGSWISVVAPVEGLSHGSGKTLLAVNENPSYLARSGYVMIGTERYDIAQAGRPPEALAFAISPDRTTASVNGANGLIAVSATPDLPWTAESQANWLTVMPAFREGAGDGNIVYTATPNSTMAERTGTIVVSAEPASEQGTRTHTVVQPAAVAAIAAEEHDYAAAGDSFELEVTVGDNVNWTISGAPGVSALPDWVKVDGSLNRIGPGKVKIAVSENQDVDERTATITVAGESFTIIQQGRTVEVEYISRIFDAEGGEGTIEVHPNGTVNWKAVSSEFWLTIWAEDGASDNPDGSVSGSSDGTIGYYVDPYVGDGESLTGTITIGDKVVYITQRAYEANISPSAATVSGNAGAGEFGFSASIGDVWNALDILCSKDWIETAQVTSFNAATKSGTIRYTYTANDSGVPRTGTIVVAGEAYQLTQSARQVARIEVEVEGGGGEVTGGGAYDVGSPVTLTATPSDGYRFTGWSGALSSTSATLAFTASVNRTYVAHFERIPVYAVNGETVREGTVVTCTAPADRIDNTGTMKLVCLGTSAYPEKGANFTLVANEDVTFDWDLWATNYLVTVDGVSGWNRAGTVKTLTPKIPSGMTFFRWTGDVACAEAGDNPLHLVVDGPKTVTSESGNLVNLLSEALDAPTMRFRTGGDGVWSAAVDAQAKTGFTAARVTTGPSSDAWLETCVSGDGQVVFNWRTVCEQDDSGACEWDRLVVFVNGVEKARIDGLVDYQTVTLPVSGERTVIRWSFYRDEYDEVDAPPVPQAWIDGIALTGSVVPADNNDSPLGGVQLWEGGPYWAECNVGATKPEEYGYYFWWGDTVGYNRNASDDGWVSVKDGSSITFNYGNCPTHGKSNSQLQSAGYIDSTGNLTAAHDAATAHLGAPWRMPTDAEFSALISNCTTTWTTQNGVEGRLVTGKGAFSSKSIFLPAAGLGYDSGLRGLGSYGICRSSTPDSDNSRYAWYLHFNSGNIYRYGGLRFYGQSVRPVRGSAQ